MVACPSKVVGKLRAKNTITPTTHGQKATLVENYGGDRQPPAIEKQIFSENFWKRKIRL